MKRATIFRIVSIVLSVLVISILIIFLFKNNIQSIFMKSEGEKMNYTYDHSVTVNNLRDLKVEWKSGNIEIIPVKADKPAVAEGEDMPAFTIKIIEETAKQLDEEEQADVYAGDGVLQIEWNKKSFIESIISNLIHLDFYQRNIYVEVPEYVLHEMENVSCSNVSGTIMLAGTAAQNVEVKTVSGYIQANAINAQNLQISSVSGAISLFEAESDTLNITSTSGEIKIGQTSVDEMKVKNVSGAIDMEAVTDQLAATTVSGEIKMNSLHCPQQADFNTVSGDIAVALPQDAGFAVNFNSISGSFSNDFLHQRRGDEFVTGDGNARLHFSTTSGSVQILVHS